jgi:hypothetical protein
MPRKKYLINLSDEESEMLLHWNDYPTPFEWGGARAARRERSRRGGHTLGGSRPVFAAQFGQNRI